MEAATFRLVAQWLSQLRQHLPPHEVMQYPQLSSEVEREQNKTEMTAVCEMHHTFLLSSIRLLTVEVWVQLPYGIWIGRSACGVSFWPITSVCPCQLSFNHYYIIHPSVIKGMDNGLVTGGNSAETRAQSRHKGMTVRWTQPTNSSWNMIRRQNNFSFGIIGGHYTVMPVALHSYACIPLHAWTLGKYEWQSGFMQYLCILQRNKMWTGIKRNYDWSFLIISSWLNFNSFVTQPTVASVWNTLATCGKRH
jgi:hypothetical protein